MASSSPHDLGETDTDSDHSTILSNYVIGVSDTESDLSDGNGSLVDKAGVVDHGRITIEDWSQTGRGVHVDFDDRETVPLTQGQFLGRGATGDVHETTVQGRKLAHKKIYFTRRVKEIEKKEISILTKLVHVHITQLIGTYTQKKILGVLMYPVAVCDLHTFFEDVEAWSNVAPTEKQPGLEADSMDYIHRSRLEELSYNFPAKNEQHKAELVYSKIGCLISAVAYLHDQKIRHKDLKPSNILLSGEKIWLSDFGSATDFTLLSQSATNNERGTPRYFAPEVADWKPSGRAADMFSLGCVLVEILCLHRRGSLDQIRKNRSADPSFHANIGELSSWLQNRDDKFSREVYYLEGEIRLMLAVNPAERPTASELLSSVTFYDMYGHETPASSIFGSCCKRKFISSKEHTAAIEELQQINKNLEKNNERRFKKTVRAHLASLTDIRKAHNAEIYQLQCRFRDDLIENSTKYEVQLDDLRAESETLRAEVEALREEKRTLRRRYDQPLLDRRFPPVSSSPIPNNPPPQKERPPYDARWPAGSFSSDRVEVDHDDQYSSNYAETSQYVDRSTTPVPESFHDPIPEETISDTLRRVPTVVLRSPMPTALSAEIVRETTGPYDEEDVSDDDQKPAKPSLRHRIASGLGLKRSGTNHDNVDAMGRLG